MTCHSFGAVGAGSLRFDYMAEELDEQYVLGHRSLNVSCTQTSCMNGRDVFFGITRHMIAPLSTAIIAEMLLLQIMSLNSK